jgi:TRAP-type C4-dicarboxylate transport system permease small subunit
MQVTRQFADATPTITITPGDLNLSDTAPRGTSADITAILNLVYMIAGIVAVIAIIIAGIRYTTSNGDSSQVQAAKNMTFYSVIGLVVVIIAAAATQFIIQMVTK